MTGQSQSLSQNQAAVLGAMGMDAQKNAESQKRQVGILYYTVYCIFYFIILFYMAILSFFLFFFLEII